jgi:predicted transcriptional regulator
MPKTEEQLERLITKVRTLPTARKRVVVQALREITDDTYVLSDDERAVLEPALARAKRGEFASDDEVDEVLNKPWS